VIILVNLFTPFYAELYLPEIPTTKFCFEYLKGRDHSKDLGTDGG